jgi:hypothetical protein
MNILLTITPNSTGGTYGSGRGGDDYDNNRSGGKDSTAGKLMEKAGSMLGSDNLEQKGRMKRDQARDDY